MAAFQILGSLEMNVYRVHPEYTQNGGLLAHWIDDGIALMETPQWKVGSVADEWPSDLIFELVRAGTDCDVLFNPCGLFFTERAMQDLDRVCGDIAEWLPIRLRDFGEVYLLHPKLAVPLGKDARFRSHEPGSNIVEVYDYDFDSPDSLPCCFLIPQPASSPAGKCGSSLLGLFVTEPLYTAMRRYRGVDFARVFPRKVKG